jgi:peptidoglycan/LPS O-acetylase OafA/YrhL
MNTKQESLSKRNIRNSSIELLKVIGIVFIVISHVVQTLTEDNKYIPYDDYIVKLSMATTNVQYLILAMCRYFGAIGNTIFFVSSCWFLLDSEKANIKKMLKMFMDIWIISVAILGITFFLEVETLM